MSLVSETVTGTVKPDGTLEIDHRLGLTPGRVRVRVEAERPAPPRSAAEVRAILEEIWAAQRARGVKPRSVEEATAAVRQMRQEWEDRMERIEQLTSQGRSRSC